MALNSNLVCATYQIVTPLFMGGADSSVNEIRPPAFKSAVRFWWRALNWCKYLDLKTLHKEECRLFGGDSNHAGQGLFLLSIQHPDFNATKKASSLTGLNYFTYGINGASKSEDRCYIEKDNKFDIEFFCKPNTKQEDIEQLKDALLALGLFGGLGAKSRRGFGSLAIQKLNETSYTFTTEEEYKKAGKTLLDKYPKHNVNKYPPYSALSHDSLWLNMASSHKELAKNYSSFLKDFQGKGNGKLEFGEPKLNHSKDNIDRRSSPLFMHIHPISSSQTANILFLPAVWTKEKPTGDQNYELVKTYLSKNSQQNWSE